MPGYPVSTLEPAKGGIACPHCKLLLRDAVQTVEEGLRLCESCYKEICCIPSRTCEDCGISLGPKEQFYRDRAVRRDVLQVNVRCNYHTNGCTWVGQLQDLEEHSTQCRYKPVCCPNEGCGQLLVPDDLDRHIDEECLYRRVNCEQCGQQECANSLKEHHRVCPKYPIECGQCKERVSRDGMELHQQHNCPYVLCAVEECSQKLLRTSLPPPSASESTEEHLTNPNRLFHHIQGLGFAVRANRKLIKKVQSECTGQDDYPSQPEVDRTVRTIENRLTVLQRMVESDRILKEGQIEELQLKLKQRDGKLEQLEQKVKFVERENKQSQQQYTYEGWTGSTNQSTRTRYDSTGVETGYATGRTDLSTERMVGLEKKMEELERQTALLKIHVSEVELQLQASLARSRRDAVDERKHCTFCDFKGTAAEVENHQNECERQPKPFHGYVQPESVPPATCTYTCNPSIALLCKVLSELLAVIHQLRSNGPTQKTLADILNELDQMKISMQEEFGEGSQLLEVLCEIQAAINQLQKDLQATLGVQREELLQRFEHTLKDFQRKVKQIQSCK